MSTTPNPGTPTPSAPVSESTATDIALSLNGYDEIAICHYFGTDYSELRERPMMFLRALIFVSERRRGAKDAEAFKTAMSLRQDQAGAYFPDEPAEVDEQETPEGKDVPPSA